MKYPPTWMSARTPDLPRPRSADGLEAETTGPTQASPAPDRGSPVCVRRPREGPQWVPAVKAVSASPHDSFSAQRRNALPRNLPARGYPGAAHAPVSRPWAQARYAASRGALCA